MAKTVGELKALLSLLDDNVILVADASDHSYRRVTAGLTEAWQDKRTKDLSEYYGPEYAGEGPGKVIAVLKFS